MLDIRKFIFSISLPLGVIALAWFVTTQQFRLPADIRDIAGQLPYAFIIIGIVLAWLFHHSREFHILLLSGASYWVIQNLDLLKQNKAFEFDVFFGLLCVLLPLNISLISVLSERGIINFHGLKRLAILVLQAMLVYWLSMVDSYHINQFLYYKFTNYPLLTKNPITQPGLVTFAAGFTSILIYSLKTPSLLLLSRASVLVCLWFVLLKINSPLYMLTWFSAIGLILASSMVLNSRQLAYLDELTQLPSRRALKQYLATLGKHYSIAMVDIDFFKKINDTHGHDVGDQVLKMLASRLRKVHGGGRAFRYGGEEFTIVFANKNSNEAAMYADALRETIADNPFLIRRNNRPKTRPQNNNKTKTTKRFPNQLKVTISIGVAQRSDLLLTTDEVFKAADKNLYVAKKQGRNRVIS